MINVTQIARAVAQKLQDSRWITGPNALEAIMEEIVPIIQKELEVEPENQTYTIECGGKRYSGIPEDSYFLIRLLICAGLKPDEYLKALSTGGASIEIIWKESGTAGISIKQPHQN